MTAEEETIQQLKDELQNLQTRKIAAHDANRETDKAYWELFHEFRDKEIELLKAEHPDIYSLAMRANEFRSDWVDLKQECREEAEKAGIKLPADFLE